MTDADKVMNPQHFGRDLVDIWIRINPAIRLGIPDHFWLNFGIGRGLHSEHSLAFLFHSFHDMV